MFDTKLRSATDAELIAAIEDCARAEASAAAMRLQAIAELVCRRCGGDERAHWACDEWDSAAAEVSAALGVSHGRASGQMDLGMSLRTRLPRVAAMFLEGELSVRIVTAIGWRTDLIQDPEALVLIDAAVTKHAGRWGALSQYKLEQAIDFWIDRHDPGALRRTQASARSRDVKISEENHESGTASLWGRLYATDAAVLQRRLTQMAHEVCDDDPRTIGQRRADALGALAAGAHRLSCRCGNPDCPSAGHDARAGSVVIHVLADADSQAAQPDPQMSGDAPGLDCESAKQSGSAVIIGGGVVSAPLLAELIRTGAKVRFLHRPPNTEESHYRPSTGLDEFVRMRDLTCRFPNCNQPAEVCDIDHTTPWPAGPTHASNLKCLCRKHHLLKTFWSSWSDRQLSDGTIIWTSPVGKTYSTLPGRRLLFPASNCTTMPLLTLPPRSSPSRAHDTMMPTRRRTRAAQRAFRIRCERALNDAAVAERNRPPPF